LNLLDLSSLHLFSFELAAKYHPLEKGMVLPEDCLLPDLQSWCKEEGFADVLFGWSEEGILINIEVEESFSQVEYPEYSLGDAIEIFIDTRDLKSAKIVSKFCHHFYVLPAVPKEGLQCGEITRFRLDEEGRPLCSPEELTVSVKNSNKGTSVRLFIPQNCLYGFDTQQIDKIGFSYLIHSKFFKRSQGFSVDPQDFNVAQVPSFWATLIL